jgi:hypothetical protein
MKNAYRAVRTRVAPYAAAPLRFTILPKMHWGSHMNKVVDVLPAWPGAARPAGAGAGRALRALLAVLLAFLAAPAFAQQQANAWVLHNASNQTLSFDTLDPARGSWKAQQVYPNQDKTFYMSPGVANGKFRIATTGRGYVEYNVVAGGRYRVVFDRNKGVWDLRSDVAPVNPPPGVAPPAASAYELRNLSNQTLSFETLDPARGTWRPQTIYPNASKRMVWNSGSNGGKIRIATDGRGYVEYDLRAGVSYDIVWNPNKRVWDVRTAGRF